MKKFSLKTWIEKIQLVAIRFTFTLFFILGLTIFFIIQIHHSDSNHHERIWTFLSLGIFLSLSVTLFSEGSKKLISIGLNLLAVILLLFYCYLLPEKFNPVDFYQVISIGIVLFLSTFVISFFKKENDIPFWEFSKESILQLFISMIFAQVLMAGLSLAILSLKELFKMDIDEKVFGDIAVICYVLFGGVYFLANVPDKTEKYSQNYNFNKFLKVLGLYIILPILAIYTLILYVYLAQILIKWQLPNGYVSTLVSVLGLGGFLSMMILFPLRVENENKVVKLLSKYFPVLLLPLIVLMSVGIFRRLGDYGLTINRLYILILNIWLYGISFYLFFSKANHLKWIVISFVTVLFLSSVGPWSVYNVTESKMMNEIEQLLTEGKLLKDGKVIDNTQKTIVLKSTLSNSLSEDVKYMASNYGIDKLQPLFKIPLKDKSWTDLIKIMGISEVPIADTYFNAWTDKENALKIDLNPYKSMIFLPSFNNEKSKLLTNAEIDITFNKMNIQVNQKSVQSSVFIIPLKFKIMEILKSQKTSSSHSIEEMTITTENFKFIITSVTGNYFSHNDSISISNCDALLFLK